MWWVCVSVFFKRTPQLQPLPHIPVKTAMDREDPYLTSIALLTSDRLVVVDYNNQSVKLVNVVQGKVLHQLEVGNMPSSVCSLPGSRAAVTLPAEKRLIILDCGNQLSIVNTITVHGRCEKVDYSNDHLIVLYTHPSKIEILTMNGGVVKQRDLELSKTYMYNYLSVIADNNVTWIFIYNINESRILRLDEDLQEQQVYPVPDRAKPLCVVAMGENQLLVSDTNYRHWQLDSTMGRWTRLKQAEWLTQADRMAFCHERNVLYYCSVRDAVKRYAIS